jgi:hypothetical protein
MSPATSRNGHGPTGQQADVDLDLLYSYWPAQDGAPTPLYEAPASANVRVLIGGHEVQWTLRGHDEGAVFARLQTLLARKEVTPLPARPAPRQGQGPPRRSQGA